MSYSLSKSEGTAFNQADRNTYQFLDRSQLDELWGPSDRRPPAHPVDQRAHRDSEDEGITLSTTFRYMSGAPFTIYDSNIDADRNGELIDPLPAGTYSGTATNAMRDVENTGGRNGAVGPDYFQLTSGPAGGGVSAAARSLEVFLDIFNITNRTNWDNPSRRPPAHRDVPRA